MKKKNKVFSQKDAKKIISSIEKTMQNKSHDSILSDVQGSYTGLGIKGEKPVQDADDL